MADWVVVMGEHGVLEEGSHDDLDAPGGTYADLFELQARSYRCPAVAPPGSRDDTGTPRPTPPAVPSRSIGQTGAKYRPVVLAVRRAIEDDLDAMVELMFTEPGVEQVAFMPSVEGARLFMRAAWRSAGVDDFLVAEDGPVVGFAWLSERGVSLADGVRAAIAGWGAAGPVRLAAKGWPRQLVEISMPQGLKLVELQAHPARRGTGVGTRLLEHVIDAAGTRSISLTTRTDNPARRLYERHGFRVTAEKHHRSFERRTGAKGRILMVRSPRSP